MPRIRPGRVRTKRTNGRPPLLLSTMRPEDFNVRPGETLSIACPDCRTWRRITGETTFKIREHSGCAETGESVKRSICPGSNQLVIIDIDVRRWQARQDRLLRDAMPQEKRRAATRFYKPLPALAAPITRIYAGVTPESARRVYLAHVEECVGCGTGLHCAQGGVLAHRYVLVRSEERARREARAEAVPTARQVQWSRSGGEVVETANNQCRPCVEGAVSDFRGPLVPTEPLRIDA